MKKYNIMTSCDDKLAPYLAVGLTAMSYNLQDSIVDFYLLHSRISRDNIIMLKGLCDNLGNKNIFFHEVMVPEPETYDVIAEYGNGWAGEAYYSLAAHTLLPEDIDRVLYLDAGDTMIIGDIEPYYNCDFQGKSLMVTGIRYKVKEGNKVMYDEDDLGDPEMGLPRILQGIFNSGSYMMNLDKIRRDGRSLSDYQYLVQTLSSIFGKDNANIYWGDQGLLSVAFVGDVCNYGYPDIRNIWYMPYNFCLWYYDRMNIEPDYEPSIVHFAGTAFKPWDGTYPVFLDRFQNRESMHSLKELKIGQAGYFYMWHEYAIMADNILKGLWQTYAKK